MAGDHRLREAWEPFVTEGQVSGVRAPVADSWRRSLAAGVDPAGPAPAATDRSEAAARWAVHPLREAAPLIRHCLQGFAEQSEHLIVVSDAAGVLLQLEGNARVRSRAADSMNFTEGALWSEDGAGTNAIGTALAGDQPMQIFAAEHFSEVVQPWTCAAAPVHDPTTGDLLGAIDLTGLQTNANPHTLAIATTAARAVEGHLALRAQAWNNRQRGDVRTLADELTASRARVVAAADEARRRIQRDLHDGAQQRLVSTVVAVRLARMELGETIGPAVELLDEALEHAEAATGELRELAHGILPGALSQGGLRAGVDALVSRARLPIAVDVTAERLPAALEATAYFIVAEALTNTLRHADADHAQITAVVDAEVLWLEVRDDGVGGARSDSSGLLGLRDRAAAVNGELRVESPPGGGTVVAARLPVPA